MESSVRLMFSINNRQSVKMCGFKMPSMSTSKKMLLYICTLSGSCILNMKQACLESIFHFRDGWMKWAFYRMIRLFNFLICLGLTNGIVFFLIPIVKYNLNNSTAEVPSFYLYKATPVSLFFSNIVLWIFKIFNVIL